MIRGILAKVLFCNTEDLGNIALHIPVGVVNVAIPIVLFLILGWPGALIGATLAIVFGIGFLTYEVIEGTRIKDKIYPDIAGWLCGIILGVVLTVVIKLVLKGLGIDPPPC